MFTQDVHMYNPPPPLPPTLPSTNNKNLEQEERRGGDGTEELESTSRADVLRRTSRDGSLVRRDGLGPGASAGGHVGGQRAGGSPAGRGGRPGAVGRLTTGRRRGRSGHLRSRVGAGGVRLLGDRADGGRDGDDLGDVLDVVGRAAGHGRGARRDGVRGGGVDGRGRVAPVGFPLSGAASSHMGDGGGGRRSGSRDDGGAAADNSGSGADDRGNNCSVIGGSRAHDREVRKGKGGQSAEEDGLVHHFEVGFGFVGGWVGGEKECWTRRYANSYC